MRVEPKWWAKARRLRAEGWSWQRIADEVGVTRRETVRRAVCPEYREKDNARLRAYRAECAERPGWIEQRRARARADYHFAKAIDPEFLGRQAARMRTRRGAKSGA